MEKYILTQNVSLSDLEALITKVIDEKLESISIHHAPIDLSKLLTRSEAASMLGVSLPTLDKWTKTGVIKAKQVGTLIRYVCSDVEALLKDLPNIKYSHKNARQI